MRHSNRFHNLRGSIQGMTQDGARKANPAVRWWHNTYTALHSFRCGGLRIAGENKEHPGECHKANISVAYEPLRKGGSNGAGVTPVTGARHRDEETAVSTVPWLLAHTDHNCLQ
jgi:hypothetical protein